MAELAEIYDIFQFYDRGDGKISISQVGNCLRALGLAPTEHQIAQLTQQWKDEEDARITVEEFTPIYRNLKKDKSEEKSPEELADCLANFDRDGNGLILVHDLRFVLTNCGEKMTEEEAEILLHGQENSEGKVNIHEFIRLISSN